MEKQPKSQKIFGKKRKIKSSVNSISETILGNVDSSSTKINDEQDLQTAPATVPNENSACDIKVDVKRKLLKKKDKKGLPVPPVNNVSPKKTKKSASVSMDEMKEKYPILKDEALIKRFTQVMMTNNQKGRIRTAIKSQLAGSDNTISPDIVYGQIKTYLIKPELTISDLRRLRILYNLLVSTIESNANKSQNDKEPGSVNVNDTAETGAKKKNKKRKTSDTGLVEELGIQNNTGDVEISKNKKRKTSIGALDNMPVVGASKKKKKQKSSKTENVDEVKDGKKNLMDTSETDGVDDEAEDSDPNKQNANENSDPVGSPKKKKKRNKKRKQATGESENAENNREETKVKGPKRYVVFVGNLPIDIKQEQLRSHFSEIEDQVQNIRIPKIKEGKQAIAFIELKSEHAYEMALSKNHSILASYNRRISVLYSTQTNSKVSKTEAKGKVAKLGALQKSGKLAGSTAMHKKRTHRRNIMKRAKAKEAAKDNA